MLIFIATSPLLTRGILIWRKIARKLLPRSRDRLQKPGWLPHWSPSDHANAADQHVESHREDQRRECCRQSAATAGKRFRRTRAK
jgi:hypothetical protein